MRRTLVVAALLFAAAPLPAQQQAAADPAPAPVAQVEAPTPASEPQEQPRTASLYVSAEQIDAQLRAEPRMQRSEMTQTQFLYTVAAIALGVLIALLLID